MLDERMIELVRIGIATLDVDTIVDAVDAALGPIAGGLSAPQTVGSSPRPITNLPMPPRSTRLIALALATVLGAPPSLMGAQSLPTNQRLYDTVTTMPELYATRIAKFEAEPVVTGRVIFLGNSITQGGDWAALTGDSTVINRGIGADLAFSLRKRLGDVTRRRGRCACSSWCCCSAFRSRCCSPGPSTSRRRA